MSISSLLIAKKHNKLHIIQSITDDFDDYSVIALAFQKTTPKTKSTVLDYYLQYHSLLYSNSFLRINQSQQLMRNNIDILSKKSR